MVLHLDEKTAKENDAFRNSEWGPEAAEAMCKEVRHLRVPGGKDGKDWTVGDIIDLTPKELISKVMLEEKLFSTWYGGRTVLLGDGKFFELVLCNAFVVFRSNITLHYRSATVGLVC